jgi:DNA-binding response OmpR family regulator
MRVLVAEDDPIMSLVYEEVLRASGHEPTVFENGRLALEAFEKAPFTMAMVDWQMPEMDGVELCRRIRALESGKAVFLLLVTAHDGADTLASALDAGADDYMAKPVTPEHLWARVTIAERRIAIDQARRTAEAALARAQWLSGIGETSLAVQHEINNPLAALLGSASLLEETTTTQTARDELVTTIVAAAKRIAEVVQRLAKLKEPKSIEYLKGARMIDLSRPDA